MESVRINKRKNEVVLSLDTRFYDPNTIKISANVFSECCNTSVGKGKSGMIRVTLSQKNAGMGIDLNTLGYEFCNYVLGTMKLHANNI